MTSSLIAVCPQSGVDAKPVHSISCSPAFELEGFVVTRSSKDGDREIGDAEECEDQESKSPFFSIIRQKFLAQSRETLQELQKASSNLANHIRGLKLPDFAEVFSLSEEADTLETNEIEAEATVENGSSLHSFPSAFTDWIEEDSLERNRNASDATAELGMQQSQSIKDKVMGASEQTYQTLSNLRAMGSLSPADEALETLQKMQDSMSIKIRKQSADASENIEHILMRM